MDSTKRTLAKTAVYRGSITVLLFGLLWVFTGDIYETSLVTIVFNIAATIIYYFHERMWVKIRWGSTISTNPALNT
ncbi:MAG: DUF2061 domain-containing protein [Nitrosarchaeum sp.]